MTTTCTETSPKAMLSYRGTKKPKPKVFHKTYGEIRGSCAFFFTSNVANHRQAKRSGAAF
jgi:hypothetical protein